MATFPKRDGEEEPWNVLKVVRADDTKRHQSPQPYDEPQLDLQATPEFSYLNTPPLSHGSASSSRGRSLLSSFPSAFSHSAQSATFASDSGSEFSSANRPSPSDSRRPRSPIFVDSGFLDPVPSALHTSSTNPTLVPKLIDCPQPDCLRKGRWGFWQEEEFLQHKRCLHPELFPEKVSRLEGLMISSYDIDKETSFWQDRSRRIELPSTRQSRPTRDPNQPSPASNNKPAKPESVVSANQRHPLSYAKVAVNEQNLESTKHDQISDVLQYVGAAHDISSEIENRNVQRMSLQKEEARTSVEELDQQERRQIYSAADPTARETVLASSECIPETSASLFRGNRDNTVVTLPTLATSSETSSTAAEAPVAMQTRASITPTIPLPLGHPIRWPGQSLNNSAEYVDVMANTPILNPEQTLNPFDKVQDEREDSSVEWSSTITSIEEDSDFSDYDLSATVATTKRKENVRFLTKWMHMIINRYIAIRQSIFTSENLAGCMSLGTGQGTPQEPGQICSGSQNSYAVGSQEESNRGSAIGKRSREDDGEFPDDRDGWGNERKAPRTSSTTMTEYQRPLLACFFHKREPWRFCKETHMRYKTCPGGFRGLHRLKEHCYRKDLHMAPIHCPRCKEEFNSDEDLEEHQERKEEGCQIRPDKVFDGITEKQKKRYEAKIRRLKTEEAKWKVIYETIFPGESAPNPLNGVADEFIDPDFLEAFVGEKLPRLSARLLNGPIEPQKSELKIILQDFAIKLNRRSAQCQAQAAVPDCPFALPSNGQEYGQDLTTISLDNSSSPSQGLVIGPLSNNVDDSVPALVSPPITETKGWSNQMAEASKNLMPEYSHCTTHEQDTEQANTAELAPGNSMDFELHCDSHATNGILPNGEHYDQGLWELDRDEGAWFERMILNSNFDFDYDNEARSYRWSAK